MDENIADDDNLSKMGSLNSSAVTVTLDSANNRVSCLNLHVTGNVLLTEWF
jgi:hypothetical protein